MSGSSQSATAFSSESSTVTDTGRRGAHTRTENSDAKLPYSTRTSTCGERPLTAGESTTALQPLPSSAAAVSDTLQPVSSELARAFSDADLVRTRATMGSLTSLPVSSAVFTSSASATCANRALALSLAT